jgi:universal stress protein A
MARSSLFRHILVPHDFSSPATLALKTAARLAKEHGGKLTVLHVLVPFYLPADVPFGMPAEADLVPEQRRQLHRLVTKALGRGGPPVTVRVEIGEASQRIIDASRRADSIVMATSGRTGLAHFLIGSVAERVVRHATVPVLTLRVPTRKRGEGRRK